MHARARASPSPRIRRSHHCGVAGHPVERLRRRGSWRCCSPTRRAPWRRGAARRRLFGTNPIAFACPARGRPPIVVDLSLSKVARGNILAAKQQGEAIPEGWALDTDGNPTTDAAAALKGTMVPLGDAKGTALALMVELLAAGLTGANYASEASSFLDAEGPPPGTGQLIIAFDPTAFGGEGASPFRGARRHDRSRARRAPPGSRRFANRAGPPDQGLIFTPALLEPRSKRQKPAGGGPSTKGEGPCCRSSNTSAKRT